MGQVVPCSQKRRKSPGGNSQSRTSAAKAVLIPSSLMSPLKRRPPKDTGWSFWS
jgi:hypothetical protein